MTYYYDRYWGVFYVPQTGSTHPEILDETSRILAFGYSGHGFYRDDPHAEKRSNEGPLPAGTYQLSGPVSTTLGGKEVGPSSWHLNLITGKLYGRAGFMIHGDTEEEDHSASDGCIVTPYWVRSQFKDKDQLVVI